MSRDIDIYCLVFVIRPRVAVVVLKTASSLIKSVIHSFPPNLQNIITPKPCELESCNFEKMFTPHHVSHVRCQVSGFTNPNLAQYLKFFARPHGRMVAAFRNSDGHAATHLRSHSLTWSLTEHTRTNMSAMVC